MNDQLLSEFSKEMASMWRPFSQNDRVQKVPIAQMQERYPFYFGNTQLGLVWIQLALQKMGYHATFENLFETPFTIMAAQGLEEFKHLILLKVHTSFAGGVPALPSSAELDAMRQFAALVFNEARFRRDIFRLSMTHVSSQLMIASIGYAWAQISLDGSSHTANGKLMDYIYDCRPSEFQLKQVVDVYEGIGKTTDE